MKIVKLHKNREKVTDRDVCHFYFSTAVVIILTNETGNCGGTFRTHFIREGEVNHGKQNCIK
ncbi:hypothetical protein CBFG_03285 [Clostridiales bacterium 1_7_47FAA]|nr:hypothetical protein CBFG_03285 [Clostridiales bacterium 1_7_47FAA]